MTSQHCVLGVAAEGRAPFGARSIGPLPPGAIEVPAASPDPALVLNQRDVELLRHLAAGASTDRAAAAMSVTSNTVRTRIRRIQVKLAVGDRGNAVRRARESGTV
jgi:DNA-binding NarL/FixJ family response regulator